MEYLTAPKGRRITTGMDAAYPATTLPLPTSRAIAYLIFFLTGILLYSAAPLLAQEACDDIIMTVHGRPDMADYLGSGLLTLPDANGDGYTDFAVSAYGRKQVLIYYGGPGILDDKEDAMLTGSGTLAGGDFNGDGLMDIAVQMIGSRIDSVTGEYLGLGIADSVYIYFAKDVDGCIYQDTPDLRLGVPGSWGHALEFGRYLEIGDINGDGYQDLIASAPVFTLPPVEPCRGGIVRIYLGSPDTPLEEEITIVPSHGCDGAFGCVVSVDDVNGDELDDIIVGVYKREDKTSQSRGSKEIYLGKRGIKQENIVVYQVLDGMTYSDLSDSAIGFAYLPVLDVNNDGNADLISKTNGGYDLDIILGSDTGYTVENRMTIHNTDRNMLGGFGFEAHAIGDWNTDGYDDYAFSYRSYLTRWLVVIPGGPLGIEDTMLARVGMNHDASEYGRLVCSGDFNGDGLQDFISSQMHDYYFVDHPKQPGVFHIVSGTGAPPVNVETPSVPSTVDLNVYPNPVTAGAALHVMLPAEASGRLQLFDALGRQVLSRQVSRKTTLSTTGLTPGVYFLTGEVGGVYQSRRVVVY